MTATTDLLTPHALQQRMLEKSAEVDTALEEYRRSIKAHIEAETRCRIAMNAALLTVDGKSAPERKAKAEQGCEAHIFEEKMAGGLREGAKESLRAKLAQLSALQSMATTIREEMRLAR